MAKITIFDWESTTTYDLLFQNKFGIKTIKFQAEIALFDSNWDHSVASKKCIQYYPLFYATDF